MATQKTPHLYLLMRITHLYFPCNTTDRIGLQHCSMFSKLLIGQGCMEKYYMGDTILYNPDQ